MNRACSVCVDGVFDVFVYMMWQDDKWEPLEPTSELHDGADYGFVLPTVCNTQLNQRLSAGRRDRRFCTPGWLSEPEPQQDMPRTLLGRALSCYGDKWQACPL